MTFDFWPLAAGLLSAGLTSIAFIPYIQGMVLGNVRPLRSTWLIWAVLSALSAAANWAEGASLSMLFVGVQAGFTTLIFLLSLRYGMGGFFRKTDLWILFIAAIGLGLWWLASSPIWTLALSLFVSALGGVATLIKTYKAPETESMICWTISAAAAGFGIISVGSLNAVLLAYPVYLFVLYTGILTAIWFGRQRGATEVMTEPALLGWASATITDFVPARDVLVIDTHGSCRGKIPSIAERGDGSGIEVSINGVKVASIFGVSGISASELRVI